MPDLQTDAIKAALENDWKKAVELNTKILKEGDPNIDCLNRLGKAYLELGESKKACTIIRKVLKLDKYDSIAIRNLARATQTDGKKAVGKSQPASISAVKINPVTSFLEEPGKTKLISLVNLAPCSELLQKDQTETVLLTPKHHTVVATDEEGNYLGALPDDVGHRLSVLIKGGNKYCALIKSVTKNTLVIFVRETCRAKRFLDTPSFITNSADYFSYIREDVSTDTKPEEAEAEDDAPMAEKLHADEEPEATA